MQVVIQAGQKGLEISLTMEGGAFNVQSNVVNVVLDGAAPITRDDVKDRSEDATQDIRSALNTTPLKETEQKLQCELSTSAHIVVLGQGTFAYKNPVFNNAGDLMIDIAHEI